MGNVGKWVSWLILKIEMGHLGGLGTWVMGQWATWSMWSCALSLATSLILDILTSFNLNHLSLSQGYFFFFLRAYTLRQRVLKIHAVGICFKSIFSFFTPTHVTSGQSGGEGWWVVNSPCLTAPPTPTLHWHFSPNICTFIFLIDQILYLSFLHYLRRFGSFSQGFFFFFKGLHFAAKGFKNSCSRNFFYKNFFSFYTPTHVTSRQSGGEGWWVVNSPCLSVNTTPKNTLLPFTPFHLSFTFHL